MWVVCHGDHGIRLCECHKEHNVSSLWLRDAYCANIPNGREYMNETKTVSITRKRLLQKGYLDAEHPLGIGGFHVEEQKSDNPRISKLLATASKKGNAGGRPEFI